MSGIEMILAIVALGFVAYDHLSPAAFRGFNALHQYWLAKNRSSRLESNQEYLLFPIQALVEISDLQFIAIQAQLPCLDLQALQERLLLNRNNYDVPTSHRSRHQLQLSSKDIFVDEDGVLYIRPATLNRLIMEKVQTRKSNKVLELQPNGRRPAVNAATGSLGYQQQRLIWNGGDRGANNRVHNSALAKSNDEDPEYLSTSLESKFVNVSNHHWNVAAGGACTEEEEEVGDAAADARTIVREKLDMDVTMEGYHAKVLEVVGSDKYPVVVRYKGKTKKGEWPTRGAIRGKSTIQIMDRCRWEQNNEQRPNIYEIEVEVVGLSAGTAAAQGFSIGVVSRRRFKKDKMPGCYDKREASVGYDCDVGEIRSARQPIPDKWGGPMKPWKVGVGERLGMVLDAAQGTLGFTVNGVLKAKLLDLRTARIGREDGLSPVLALRGPCELRILKFGWAAPPIYSSNWN